MDDEKIKLYYIIEHQAKVIKMQAKDIKTLNCGMWSIFCIFIIYAAVNLALSFSTKITDAFIRLWRVIK
jgi:hypothetical protein